MKIFSTLARALSVLLLVAACAGNRPLPSQPSPATPDLPADDQNPQDRELSQQVGELVELARSVDAEQAAIYWKTWTEGEPLAASELDAKAARLESRESFEKVSALAARVPGTAEARALERLRMRLAAAIAAKQVAPESERLARAIATGTLRFDEQEVPLRDLEATLAAEAHPRRRRELAHAAGPALGEIRKLSEERERALGKALASLGFASTAAFAAEQRGFDPEALRALAEAVLERTEKPYRSALAALGKRELRLSAGDLRRCDLPRLFRTGLVDSSFPKERMAETLESSLSAMGLGLASLGVKVDAEARPLKSPRALSMAIDPPSDVRLSIKPATGLAPLAQAFDQAGHAVVSSLAGPKGYTDQVLGNPLPADAFSAMLERMLGEPDFASGLGVPEDKLVPHVQMSALRSIHALRRDAGRVLCALATPDQAEAVCAAAMERAYGVPVEEEADRRTNGRGELLAAADALRARIASGQLEALLASELGERWWSDPKSGARLRELLAGASAGTAEEWLARMGAKSLDPEPLVRGLESGLAFAAK